MFSTPAVRGWTPTSMIGGARPLKAIFDHNIGRIGEAASVAGWWKPILLAHR